MNLAQCFLVCGLTLFGSTLLGRPLEKEAPSKLEIYDDEGRVRMRLGLMSERGDTYGVRIFSAEGELMSEFVAGGKQQRLSFHRADGTATVELVGAFKAHPHVPEAKLLIVGPADEPGRPTWERSAARLGINGLEMTAFAGDRISLGFGQNGVTPHLWMRARGLPDIWEKARLAGRGGRWINPQIKLTSQSGAEASIGFDPEDPDSILIEQPD